MKLIYKLLISFVCITIVMVPGAYLSERCGYKLPLKSKNPCETCLCINNYKYCRSIPCNKTGVNNSQIKATSVKPVSIPGVTGSQLEAKSVKPYSIQGVAENQLKARPVRSVSIPGVLSSKKLSEDCNPFIPIPVDNPCQICRCIRGQKNCRTRTCDEQPADNCIAFKKPGECCPEYLCGKERFHCNPRRIVHLKSSSPCEICRCKKGRIRCRPKPCPAPPSENCERSWRTNEQCCPDYDCEYTEDNAEDGSL